LLSTKSTGLCLAVRANEHFNHALKLLHLQVHYLTQSPVYTMSPKALSQYRILKM